MKKLGTILISALLIFAMLFSMLACTGDTNDGSDSEKPSESSGSLDSNIDGSESESDTGKDTSKDTNKDTTKKTEASTVKQPVYKNRTVSLSGIWARKVKQIGRTEINNAGGINCDWSASGIAFKVEMKGEMTVTVDVTGQTTYFTVIVDGQRLSTRFSASSGTNKTITFSVPGNEIAEHEIEILKQTQMQYSTLTIKKLAYYGEDIKGPAENKDYYIEIIGDSITCGHGNLVANGADGQGNSLGEDATKAYSYLTAQLLEADHSLVSYSGIGLVRGWSNYGNSADYMKMKDIYTYMSWKRSGTKAYDFENARKPDVVVINLGTNDNSFLSPKADFKSAVKNMIEVVRSKYGEDTPIVWAYGMMHTDYKDNNNVEHYYNQWIKDAIAEMGGEGAGIYTVQLNNNTQGGQGHPTAAAHETAAETLATFIESKNILY